MLNIQARRIPPLILCKKLQRCSSSLSEGPLGIYSSYLNRNILNPDEHQHQAVLKLQELYNRVERYNPKDSLPGSIPKGLYLYGSVGSGKTALMDIFYDSLATKYKKRVHFNSFMLQLYSELNRWNLCYSSDESTFETTPIETLANHLTDQAWLICFDEIQVSDYGAVRLLEGVFQHMFNKGFVVVATSNRSPTDLGGSSFGRESEAQESVLSLMGLLSANCEEVSLDTGLDYRNSKKPGKSTFFYPLNGDTEALFNESFCKAVGPGTRLTRAALQVYGRHVIVPIASSNGVARFSFAELCKSPLGPADYITICNTYHTIFVEGIPQLSIYQKNEARRLLSFVDAAYESRVQVYCLAEAEPKELFQLIPKENQSSYNDKMHLEMIGEMAYDLQLTDLSLRSLGILTGEDEIFSFRRCISRLSEMQSDLYQHSQHRLQLFMPYVGTSAEQNASDLRRRKREHKRKEYLLAKDEDDKKNEPEELPRTPLMSSSTDWGDEASYLSWSNDVMRKELNDLKRAQDEKRRMISRKQAPKFSEQHFWGFGWWEKIVGPRKK